MAYSPTTWVDDTEPPINAANLNKIEQGIVTADRSEVFAQTAEPTTAVVAALWADTTTPQTPGGAGGWSGPRITVGPVAPSSPAINDIWVDTN